MKIIYEDLDKKILIKAKDERVMEVIFYDSLLHNIYRAKVVNKIDSLGAYFVEIPGGEKLFLKSTLGYKIGDSVVVEYVRDPANGKLGLASENFKLENKAYRITRYPLRKRPRLKKGLEKDLGLYEDIKAKKKWLIRQEKFLPSPKILLDRSIRDDYINDHPDYEVKAFDISKSSMFLDLKNNLLTNELEYKLMSIIIDELETMTVVDVNTAAKKSKQRKKDFLLNINLEIIDFIVYNLKLRNIGGMVIIDFLRSGGEDKIRQELKKAIDKYDLEGEIFGFTPMGLFEMTIKRRGDSLRANLEKRNLLS